MKGTDIKRTKATLDKSKNRVSLIIAGILSLVGIGLVVAGVMLSWGFLPIFWSSILALLATASVFGSLKGGGFAKAPCPHCGKELSFTHIKTIRTLQCEGCNEWSTGQEFMEPVGSHFVSRDAVFTVSLPSGEVQWPTNEAGAVMCPVCACAATDRKQMEATDMLGDMAASISPISLQKVHKLQAPICPNHDDGVDFSVAGSEIELAFRSYSYYRSFQKLNGVNSKSHSPTPMN